MSLFKKLFKKDKERFKIPKSVQQAIPIETAYTDGVFQVGKKRYSKTYRFTDINYSVASDEDNASQHKGGCARIYAGMQGRGA